ncbi:metallophosphoesterase [Planctopirus limnophila DSM 3776]|uniref:Metallophosphoesterase n=1 Tax=Planctopirus limnophila (strain ATCC 43296 / DSM 3776 / IFAM 1008 / Mu 290) TaxID=521674 RepID=D5SQD8_PLAL2|nr:metallophosphoesterase family protein [Planctopirus limnophila]ADG66390.1 metallophosphoesterase [Planctopirus limnophila DSM 3776]
MNVVDRRQFLGLTLSAAAFSAASNLLPFDDRYAHGKVLGADGMPVSPQVEGPETMFLTWPGDPTSTICIQWVDQDHGNELEIAYSPLESDNWQIAKVTTKPFPMTKDKVYRASISSLQPGTEYRFRMGADAPTFRFRTMPKKLTDTFHFVSGGDAGTGSHAIGTNQLAARQEPYFALLAGDLAYDNGKSPRTFIKFLKNYRAHMVDPQGRLIPLLACPGNHEVDGAYKQPREKAGSYLSVFDCFFPDTTYGVYDIGDDFSLVLLDTDHISPIEGEQTSWLEKTLAARQDKKHLFVANHVPAYPSYRAANIDSDKPGTGAAQRKLWCPLFERYNVDVVLEHHDHLFKRSHPLTDGRKDKYGVPYLGDGSWGMLRPLKEPELRPYLAKVSSSYHMTAHHLEGDERFHIALEENGRIADVCMTRNKRAARRG